MPAVAAFDAAFARCPLIAILRGIRPDEAVAVGEAVVAAGFTILEVPLNSPEPLASIRLLASALAGRAVVGAGTVYRAAEVDAVAEAGGTLIVSPTVSSAVIGRTVDRGMVSAPGVMTPTEAVAALDAGATILKLFPGEIIGPAGVRAMAAVLPGQPRLVVVGGIVPDTMAAFARTPAAGFGIGSALYSPGLSSVEVGGRAVAFVSAWRALRP
ncbi:MAG: 2-dehydro-3-deoxy-6-phosphogalactonate aldolase [Alsobacter sp.]